VRPPYGWMPTSMIALALKPQRRHVLAGADPAEFRHRRRG
jgi:hypothetical protein